MYKNGPMELFDKAPQLSRKARVRLGALLEEIEDFLQSHNKRYGHLFKAMHSLGQAVHVLRREFGREIALDSYDLRGFCLEERNELICEFLMATYVYLFRLQGQIVPSENLDGFVRDVEEILIQDNFPLMFKGRQWEWRVDSDAEVLRRALLANPADVAECRQGDPQVEMVVSTVQIILAKPDPVLVDYGAGLGRVLGGLGTAERFRNAKYIAVDEPVADDVHVLAETVGAKFIARSREDFLAHPDPADVIILVNTLHHIPFADLPRQISTMLGALKHGGVLVIQEIGELRQPEQHNVPWRIEDIINLFSLPGCDTNPRSTMTRSQRVPLTHMMVHVTGDPPTSDMIVEKAKTLWKRMKERTLEEIANLYKSRNPEDQILLQYALIANANLDLNQPE